MEAKLTGRDFKPTVADYLKLLQIEKEVEEKELEGKPKEITVTWVDPTKHQPENSLQTSAVPAEIPPGVFQQLWIWQSRSLIRRIAWTGYKVRLNSMWIQ